MPDRESLFRIGNQPPLIQLIVSLIMIVIAGTIFFYLFILAGSLVTGISLDEMLGALDSPGTGREDIFVLRYLQVSQQVGLFLMPAVISILLVRKNQEDYAGIAKAPGVVSIFAVILLSVSIIPVTTYAGILNSAMELPDSMPAIENWIRTKENEAMRLTGLLISSSGSAALVINMLIMAVVPAFCEEFLFRGLIQQLFCRLLRSPHAGIFIAAIIFSTIHFQFYGFIPRLILGLIYGYLFFWTGSLWLVIAAHFINNSIPVVIAYFTVFHGASDTTGKSIAIGETFPLFQVILIIIILFYFFSEYRKRLRAESG
jgi:hypothetical protein